MERNDIRKSTMHAGQYRKVSVSEELVIRIENIVENGQFGYRSISDFVHEAVRMRLQQLQKTGDQKG
jgi:Arc/MetJ-type ribon-helix-helix transcriptional regulator